ncbi:deoxyguanosinetriphosphate triphosphohydrolase [Luteipulveratus mongoliensis]|uniref:Deoxyguanosinetriphosphate triphosphohydrolase-like protein n=1 Tax=Luteipulveratus mongoliensis TaxID=571913 RepID=A0A0K1JJ11_9MICO|nr:deoxyguanosinetriphosphate triphosphohydrolase [Luteipulveratus mongoliensis]AKU16583.1 deoxyguanosinetriphosphate triphosphohydrolase [Luteipulveratus mongoliensis]
MSGPYDARSRERWVQEDPELKRADRDDFARDRARLVHSAALRRLSQKTQMHQPTVDDFVRNRLTHSLEVAQIGREFGAALGCNADVVDTACLAHDLGHPPFGHNGETALDALAADFGGFEGNAQTLRLLTRLEAKRAHADGRSAGLNLTRASLDASIKYPWARGESPTPTRKFGVYADDVDVFSWVRADVPADAPTRRCLEAQVMDWSDDVAYSVHDVEDAIASGLVDLRALRSGAVVEEIAGIAQRLHAPEIETEALTAALGRALEAGAMPNVHDGTRGSLAALKDTTSRLIGHFVQTVEEATRERFGGGSLTRYDADVVIPDDVWAECVMLKAVAAHFVLLTDTRQRLHADQRDVVIALFGAYRDRPERLDPIYAMDFADGADDAARLRVVVDQVASMTDGRAIELAQAWT